MGGNIMFMFSKFIGLALERRLEMTQFLWIAFIIIVIGMLFA